MVTVTGPDLLYWRLLHKHLFPQLTKKYAEWTKFVDIINSHIVHKSSSIWVTFYDRLNTFKTSTKYLLIDIRRKVLVWNVPSLICTWVDLVWRRRVPECFTQWPIPTRLLLLQRYIHRFLLMLLEIYANWIVSITRTGLCPYLNLAKKAA